MKKNYHDEDYPQTNRDKKLTPKLCISWCDKCDANLVGDNQKCSVCGHRQGKRFRYK